ncbi:MAG: hypothetical protein B1H13_08475 [Desulfobacteraceae bacterium 4484_190.3]|nr:MAG: hypothetical protein B1H13_08475 [Desulfobacteraceae bacterium 4484_190.3]
MDFKILTQLRRHLSMAHHVPGRIRIKFNSSLSDYPQATEILNSFKSLPGIKNVRINFLGRSFVIEYDRKRIHPDLLQEFFTTEDFSQAQTIAGELAKQFNLII